MSDTVIEIQNIGKKYHIGGMQAPYKNFRDSIVSTIQTPFIKAAKLLRGQAYGAAGMNEIIWALKDVSFNVNNGEVIGIIGKNGAGKSTLLKILSRITEPTEGQIKIKGRLGSLLEVGTGFHPELTGRENIFLNGAILGMKRVEILRKFDEIVAFSEIEKFIDTPVKYYSSGMYVRLAFAVAAHLEPDILIVDEVLAVGDIAFQKKCMGKMENVGKEGRTVILVSHNMAAIMNLCQKVVLIDKGRVEKIGAASEVVDHYRNECCAVMESKENIPGLWAPEFDYDKYDAYIDKVEMIDPKTGKRKEELYTGDSVTFRLHYRSNIEAKGASFWFILRNSDNVILLRHSTDHDLIESPIHKGKSGYIDCSFSELPFTVGKYMFEVHISIVKCGYLFKPDIYGEIQIFHPSNIKSSSPYDSSHCLVYIPHQWQQIENE